MQYCKWPNNQENFDCSKQKQTTVSFSSNSEDYQIPKPFHSPQLSFTKCQLSQKRITFSPNQTIHLETKNSKNSILFNQTEQIQYPATSLKLNHSTSSNQSYTPSTSCFDSEYLISPEQLSLNNGFDKINNSQSSSFDNYFQRNPFLDSYCTKNACLNNNNNNNFKQSKQFNNFVNHFSSPIQSIKTRFRKQSFNLPTNPVDEESDYQFRSRAGSHQLQNNNHLQNPAKKKQIDERGQRKQKRHYKTQYKSLNNKQSSPQYNENIGQNVFKNVVLDELHDYDNHRITNEDLITTHQEQMKEENQSNNDDEFNISEKEDDIDNLDEITLQSTHKNNYGCSMIDTILDELENEDELKIEIQSNNMITSCQQNKIITLNELDCPSITNLETKTDFTPSKNSECDSNCMFGIQQSQSSKVANSQQNMKFLSQQSCNDGINFQQQIENSKSDQTYDNIAIEENTPKQNFIKEDQQCFSLNNIQEDLQNSEKDLKILLDVANQQIKNPQVLFDIVQKLATQLRQKDQMIRTMENDSSQFQIVSLSQIPSQSQIPQQADDIDSNSLRARLKHLTINEKIQQEQQKNKDL